MGVRLIQVYCTFICNITISIEVRGGGLRLVGGGGNQPPRELLLRRLSGKTVYQLQFQVVG